MIYEKLFNLIDQTKGITKTNLADRIGVSPQQLSYQLKHKKLSVENLQRICVVFNKSMDYFFEWPETMGENPEGHRTVPDTPTSSLVHISHSGKGCSDCPVVKYLTAIIDELRDDKKIFMKIIYESGIFESVPNSTFHQAWKNWSEKDRMAVIDSIEERMKQREQEKK